MEIKYTIKPTAQFKRDLKRCKRSGLDLDKLKYVIHLLKCGEVLPEQYHDHSLHGKRKGCRECHISPDWLLIYRINNGELCITLVNTGSHSELFGM